MENVYPSGLLYYEVNRRDVAVYFKMNADSLTWHSPDVGMGGSVSLSVESFTVTIPDALRQIFVLADKFPDLVNERTVKVLAK